LTLAWRARHPRRPVLCKTAHDFLGEFNQAIETQALSDFRRSYRRASLLILEDLGRLAGKDAAQEEFVQTLDTLADDDHQMIVTAVLPPGQMPRIGPRLQSRLAAGLCVPLVAPAPATRHVMLQTMVSSRGMEISTPATRLLASAFPTAPELLGAVTDLRMRTADGGGRIDVNLARQYLAERHGPTPPTLEKIAQATARAFSLRLSQLRSPSRSRAVVTARGVAMYLARKLTEHSLQQIGLYFGGRDHTTVLHGCRKTEMLLEEEPEIRLTLESVREQLGTNYG